MISRRYKLHIGVACAAVQLAAIAGVFGVYYRENSPQAAISARSRRDISARDLSACTTGTSDTYPIPRGRSCTIEGSYTSACYSLRSRRRFDTHSAGTTRTSRTGGTSSRGLRSRRIYSRVQVAHRTGPDTCPGGPIAALGAQYLPSGPNNRTMLVISM